MTYYPTEYHAILAVDCWATGVQRHLYHLDDDDWNWWVETLALRARMLTEGCEEDRIEWN